MTGLDFNILSVCLCETICRYESRFF